MQSLIETNGMFTLFSSFTLAHKLNVLNLVMLCRETHGAKSSKGKVIGSILSLSPSRREPVNVSISALFLQQCVLGWFWEVSAGACCSFLEPAIRRTLLGLIWATVILIWKVTFANRYRTVVLINPILSYAHSRKPLQYLSHHLVAKFWHFNGDHCILSCTTEFFRNPPLRPTYLQMQE